MLCKCCAGRQDGKPGLHRAEHFSVITRLLSKAIKVSVGNGKIYAGADLFLMPSKSEPCGLSQMVALRYGTLPIVRETGGLKDSITDCGDGHGNGFTFKTYDAYDMLGAIYRGVDAYNSKDWKVLVKRALECDMSWGKSANEYIKMYRSLLK